MKVASSHPHSLLDSLTVSLWFGVVTGVVEGFGLLLFQRINWERWAPMVHMSVPILWFSPLVDCLFFAILALPVIAVTRLFPRLPLIRSLAFLFSGLAVYDWLTLTGRLQSRSRWLLALGIAVTLVRWLAKHEAEAMRFWRRTVLWIAAAVIFMCVAIRGQRWMAERSAMAQLPVAAPGTPNVLVIVVDTLRADHLSCYGNARPTSPNIDRLAREGVLFENAVSAGSWTYPTHISLVTGLYEFQHGLGNVPPAPIFGSDKKGLNGHATIAEELQKYGFRTGAFSANRAFFVSNLGFDRGFSRFDDYFYSIADTFIRTILGQEAARIYHKPKVKQRLRRLGLERWIDLGTQGFASYGTPQTIVRKPANIINNEVLRWIDHSPSDRPFFAFLNYFDVHDPYGGPRSFTKPDWDKGDMVEEYDAGIKYVDDSIGRLITELDRRNLSRNTMIIVVSDHGESLGNHQLQGHGQTLYWGLIHVPLIVWYPGHVPSGVRITRPVSSTAIPATIMEMLGDNTKTFQGPPLNWLWQKPQVAADWPTPVAELAQNKFLTRDDKSAAGRRATSQTGSLKSLNTPEWHLITHDTEGNQLYSWISDPEETNNLIDTPEGKITSRIEFRGRRLELSKKVTPNKKGQVIVGAPALVGFLKSLAGGAKLMRTCVLLDTNYEGTDSRTIVEKY
jgi:arylsulfatase A-like enzyme